MCDTVVIVRKDGVLFGKNSDRDANEAQVLDWQPRRRHAPGASLRCTWIEIPQVEETRAVLLSRPFWMWGAEIGANEDGVVIGNEAVFTLQPKGPPALTGMDLVRLALERSRTAEEAAGVIVALLEEYGQGGRCGLESASFTYHNSFLIADANGAIVLETAGRHHVRERVGEGVRTVSNVLTIEPFARRYSDALYTWAGGGRIRRARTAQLAAGVGDAAGVMALLRDHGPGGEVPRYHWLRGTLNAPCVHGGGLFANSVTAASWVSEIGPDGARHWATATASPCIALYKPVRIDEGVDLGNPRDADDGASLWWRHERLHRLWLTDPAHLGDLFRAERDAVEARWHASPPAPAAAFAEGDALLERWTAAVAGEVAADLRPWWARRYWRQRQRTAHLPEPLMR